MRGLNVGTQLAMSTQSGLNRASYLYSHRFWYATYGFEETVVWITHARKCSEGCQDASRGHIPAERLQLQC